MKGTSKFLANAAADNGSACAHAVDAHNIAGKQNNNAVKQENRRTGRSWKRKKLRGYFMSQSNISQILIRIFCLLSCILGLISCAAPAPTFQLGEKLAATEGGLILMNHSEFDNIVFQLEETGGKKRVFASPSFSAGIQFHVIKLPAGQYTIKRVLMSTVEFDRFPLAFQVDAGKLNYPGDIFVSRAYHEGKYIPYTMEVQLLDKQEKLESYLNGRFPSLLQQYELATHFQQSKDQSK